MEAFKVSQHHIDSNLAEFRIEICQSQKDAVMKALNQLPLPLQVPLTSFSSDMADRVQMGELRTPLPSSLMSVFENLRP